MRELPGEVEHIVLPTFAVEHKQFVGPFSRAFPRAKVHVAPRCDFPSGVCSNYTCFTLPLCPLIIIDNMMWPMLASTVIHVC